MKPIWVALQAEQPGSSCLKDCPYISHVLTTMGPNFFHRMWMGSFGHWASKPSQLWGSWQHSWTLIAFSDKDFGHFKFGLTTNLLYRLPPWSWKNGIGHLRPSLQSIGGKLPREVQNHLQRTSEGMYSKQKLPDGRVRVTGGKRLKQSGAYVAGFGKRVAHLLKRQKLRASWQTLCQTCRFVYGLPIQLHR